MQCTIPIALSILIAAQLGAQTIGQNKSPSGDTTFTLSVKSQLVVESVMVKDKQGNPVSGLTAKDFTLAEDGVLQDIRIADHQRLPSTGTPFPPQSKEKEQITIYNHLTRTQIAGESGDSLKYKDHRLIALYFDLTAMRPVDQYRALAAAEKFIREQMSPADFVSVLRYSGGAVDVLQDFSADRNRLLSILETLVVGEGQGYADSIEDASSADVGAAFGQDDSEFNVFNTDRQLSALQTAARMLGQLNEKKVLVYFAGGMRLNGADNQAQLSATIDAAVRAGVSFWPVDARGLIAAAPLGDATQGSPGNEGVYSGAAAGAVQSNLQRSQDTMYALAKDTGGAALLDSNDLGLGIRNAQASVSDYYILGYYTKNAAPDGRFRHIKITVNNPDWKLEYRQGYYAGKEFGKFNVADKERQLEDALMMEDPITELTIAMELNYFQLNRAEYFVPITVKIPGRELALAKKGGAAQTLIDFIGEIKDAHAGITITNVRDNVKIKLSDATAAELAHRPIEYDAGFTLLPGKYIIKFLARDEETGRIGTYQTTFTIPNLNMEEKRVPISSVVLGNQRVNMNDALYNAQKGKDLAKQMAQNPLIEGNQKLIPSVTRVFSKSRSLYVYLQGYEHGAAIAEPLVGYVTLYKGGGKQVETKPVVITPASGTKLTPVPMSFTVDLGQLPDGEYDCQVTVLAPKSARTQFWRGPMNIVP
jgi:VWFA-related protein